jgi:hypothetical protein
MALSTHKAAVGIRSCGLRNGVKPFSGSKRAPVVVRAAEEEAAPVEAAAAEEAPAPVVESADFSFNYTE